MKFTVNIDCTPEEARRFFGLPDVTAVNQVIVDQLEKRTKENLETLTDPQKYVENMLAMSGSNMEKMQGAFAAMMAGMTGSETKK